jgi:beta-mannanase
MLNGNYDTQITAFANAAAAFGHPVRVAFMSEFNVPANTWSTDSGLTVTKYKSAWQYFFNKVNPIAPLVKFVFAPSTLVGDHESFDTHWPGNTYVQFKGLDGYIRSDSDTYASVFHASVTDILNLGSNKPWMVSETGVNQNDTNPVAQVHDLVTGAYTDGAESVNYFDATDSAGNVWTMTTTEANKFLCDAGYTQFC